MPPQQKPAIVFLTEGERDPYGYGDRYRTLGRSLSFRYAVDSVHSLSNHLPQGSTLVVTSLAATMDAGDVDALRRHRARGGGVLVMLPGGAAPSAALQQYLGTCGIQDTRTDLVVSSFYTQGLYHPTHVLLESSSFSCASLTTKVEKLRGQGSSPISYVYPRGATFAVDPSVASVVLTSGEGAFPASQPVLACQEIGGQQEGGRLAVLGSGDMFTNEFIGMRENRFLADALFSWCARRSDSFNAAASARSAEPGELLSVPDTATTSKNLRACLHAPDPLPDDFRDMVETPAPADASALPAVSALYEKMGFSRAEPTLKLVNPSFEKPTPPLIPAVHAPVLPDPPGTPMLELYDLDVELATDDVRLDRLALKCTKDDTELFVNEAGELFGIQGGPKDILYKCLLTVIEAKRSMN